jgi:hypothetical protein
MTRGDVLELDADVAMCRRSGLSAMEISLRTVPLEVVKETSGIGQVQ